jgi:hypothetical protein
MTFEAFYELAMRVCPARLADCINRVRVREGAYVVEMDSPHEDIRIASWMPDSNVEETLEKAFAELAVNT